MMMKRMTSRKKKREQENTEKSSIKRINKENVQNEIIVKKKTKI